MKGFSFYRRVPNGTIFARDPLGRYLTFRMSTGGGRAILMPSRGLSLGPTYGRINHRGGRRFTAHVRTASALRQAFESATETKVSGWQSLPSVRSNKRRTSNQGMTGTMEALTGDSRSANEYVEWLDRGLDARKWEWCHLISHATGGRDDESNIVAGVKGNNTEQLVIENALQLYRTENAFDFQVSAAVADGADGKHLGDVIRYEVRFRADPSTYSRDLDCQRAPAKVSLIHATAVQRSFARWANEQPVSASPYVSDAEMRACIRCVANRTRRNTKLRVFYKTCLSTWL